VHGFCYRFWFNRIVLIFKRTAYSLFLFNTIQFITFYILELEHYYSTENWNSENENCGVRIDFDNGTLLTCSYHIYIFFIVWCHSYLAAVYCLILTVPILVHEGIAKHTHTHTHTSISDTWQRMTPARWRMAFLIFRRRRVEISPTER